MEHFLISINKPHTDNILKGIKGIEWRTKPLPNGLYEMYETKNKCGLGKAVGQMEIIGNTKIKLNEIDKNHIDMGCVPYEFLVEYAKDKEYLYANFIGKVGKYDKPKELSDFTTQCKYDIPFTRNINCNSCVYYEQENKIVGWCLCGGHKPITRPPQFYCRID
jgi:predicted transcriptional regulator